MSTVKTVRRQDPARTLSGLCQDSVRTMSGLCQDSVRTVRTVAGAPQTRLFAVKSCTQRLGLSDPNPNPNPNPNPLPLPLTLTTRITVLLRGRRARRCRRISRVGVLYFGGGAHLKNIEATHTSSSA